MRSMKKIIALVMVAMMLVAAFALNTFASESADYSDAAKNLGSIKIMKGDKNGDLMLDQGVTRYQAALFFVQALTGETDVEKWNADKQSAVFSDVPEYGTAIDLANGMGLIRGRGNGTYGYNDPITYQDMLVLAVRALGYETENMNYPYGYMEAAKKLGLTKNLASGIGNTQPLTRGETAQIIWDMLGIEIAIVDPISDKLVYPGEIIAGEAILGDFGFAMERTNLLKKAGFTRGVIEDKIVEYKEAKLSSDIATVVLEGGLEIAASEFGITARTNPSTFLGLPVTIYVDCEAEKFDSLYDVIEEDSEASIIFVDTLEFTNVVNVGEQTNIKVVERDSGEIRVTLGDKTFGEKYDIDIYTLDAEDGWVLDEETDFYANFLYEDGEFVGNNSYGEVDYAVTVDEEAKVYNVMVLYKPYEFGLYNTRTIRYQPTSSDESLITIGKYNPMAIAYNQSGSIIAASSYKNPADKYSYFEEYLLGSNVPVDKNTTSVSKRDGEAARDARLSGESVRSGDFIFYYYNALDNVLTIGYNCGALKDGTLTAKSDKAETVKIDGTTYTYEVPGAFTFARGEELPKYDGDTITNEYISALVSGEKNVQYFAVDNKVFYVQEVLNGSNYRAKHNYIITTTEAEIMADLLGIKESEYEKKIADTAGVYVSDNGYITVAVLNTANGKWGLAEIAQYECGADKNGKLTVTSTGSGAYAFDYKESKFAFEFDIKKELKNYIAFGDDYNGAANFKKVIAEILKGGMFAVRGKSGNVYNISVMFGANDWGMIDNGLVTDGLFFSENGNKTNKVLTTRRAGADSARITISDSTVIVVIDKNDNVGVRVGLQGADDSIILNYTSSKGESVTAAEKEKIPCFLYSGTKNLIVLRLSADSDYKVDGNDKDTGETDSSEKITLSITHNDGTPFNVADWQGAAKAGNDETYYVGLSDAAVETARLDDGTYELTVTGIFNLRTMRAVSAIKLNVEDIDDADVNIDDFDSLAGEVLYMDKYGDLSVVETTVEEALIASVNMDADKGEEVVAVDMSGVEFIDESSVKMDEFGLEAKEAIAEINVKVITLDVTGLDLTKFDITKIAINEEFDEKNEWGATSVEYEKNVDYFAYDIGDLNAVENINEPVADVLDQYIIDKAGKLMFVAETDDTYFEDAETVRVDLYAAGNFNEDDGVLTLYVVKVLDKVEVQ